MLHHRIRTIYRKELIDILRDHRTLIAMIVVPIVLYPLLLLGSVQAVSYQTEKFSEEELIIGVLSDEQGRALDRLIRADAGTIHAEQDKLDEADDSTAAQVVPIDKYRIAPLGSVDAIKAAVADRSIFVGITFDSDALVDAPNVTNRVQFYLDRESPRSQSAYNRVRDVFERTAERTRMRRVTEAQLPPEFVYPFAVETINLSAPQSILGQILPLILVLMTITGAIYPAIDLTAGERERGTLESLMVCPMPVFDLIVGKFLVVTTVAILGAALNLASVSATVYFGGFRQIIAQEGGGVPIGSMVFILLCLIPFAVFMSAIMIAVCSYARTFKEAQNYVTPVILAVLIPGGIAALPTTQLTGVMLVMPVGNMVLLARELLMGAVVPAVSVVMVMVSTTLYAAAAVGVAASVFGKESVIFADAGSWRTMFDRRLIRPSSQPGVTMSLMTVAILFPVWFFVQSSLQPESGADASGILINTGWFMPLLFVVLPLMILLYWRVDWRRSFALAMPGGRFVVAAILIGISAWVPAHELNALQARWLGVPEAVLQSAAVMEQALQAMSPAVVVLLIALIPAFCEEILFRGFLLSGLRGQIGRGAAIATSAAMFGAFHFFLFKFPTTAALGAVLGYLCWQSRSIWPAIIAHALHNGLGVSTVFFPQWQGWLGIEMVTDRGSTETLQALEVLQRHLPLPVIIGGCVVCIVGLLLVSRAGKRDTIHASAAPVPDPT